MTNTPFTRLPKLAILFIATAVIVGSCTIPEADEAAEPIGNSTPSQDATEEVETIETEVSGISVTAEDSMESDDAEQDGEGAAAATESTFWAIEGVPVGLNVRSGAGVEFEILAQVTKDRVLTGTGETSGGWVEVTIDDVTGWVHGDYLACLLYTSDAADE